MGCGPSTQAPYQGNTARVQALATQPQQQPPSVAHAQLPAVAQAHHPVAQAQPVVAQAQPMGGAVQELTNQLDRRR